MLGRVETRQRTVPVARGVQEHKAANDHTDHAIKRESKTTQLGLAPAFEMLPDEGIDAKATTPAPRKPTPPPPPPESRKPAPTPMYQEDDNFEPELARMLEGPATLLAPAPTSHGMPAWIQVLLLVTVLAGLGVTGWQLWVRGHLDTEVSVATKSTDSGASSQAEGKKGPITGPVNGLEAVEQVDAESARSSGGRRRRTKSGTR